MVITRDLLGPAATRRPPLRTHGRRPRLGLGRWPCMATWLLRKLSCMLHSCYCAQDTLDASVQARGGPTGIPTVPRSRYSHAALLRRHRAACQTETSRVHLQPSMQSVCPGYNLDTGTDCVGNDQAGASSTGPSCPSAPVPSQQPVPDPRWFLFLKSGRHMPWPQLSERVLSISSLIDHSNLSFTWVPGRWLELLRPQAPRTSPFQRHDGAILAAC